MIRSLFGKVAAFLVVAVCSMASAFAEDVPVVVGGLITIDPSKTGAAAISVTPGGLAAAVVVLFVTCVVGMLALPIARKVIGWILSFIRRG
jgi:hypothetical protein